MKNEEIKITGIPIVPGKAYGKAYYVGRSVGTFEKKSISKNEVGTQIMLLNRVREEAKKSYEDYINQAQTDDDSVDHSILKVYSHILDDPAFVGQIVEMVSTQLVSLDTAIKLVSNDFIKRFSAAQTSYFRERGSDMVEICEKLISLIDKEEKKVLLREPVVIIVPRTFIPSDLLTYDLAMVKGIVALNAGTTSHAVILARTYEIPVISGIKDTKRYIRPNSPIFLDAGKGVVYVNPSESKLKVFQSYQLVYESARALSKKWNRPVYTKDGIHIKIMANVALLDDVEYAQRYGADGIGLVRSEYLYYMYNRLPTEKDQQDYFEGIFNLAKGKYSPTIRLLDIGADKMPGVIEFPKEINPSLGWRGIRILLQRKTLFREHLSAIMKAADGRPYSIMIPMVSTLREWREAKEFIMDVAKELNVATPPCGVLFEVPLALMEMESYLGEVDFVSIGTNDLIQYLFAADRNNPSVNYLHNPVEPAFLNILRRAIATAKDHGIPLSICGEIAGSPLYTILLVGLGLTMFSVAPHTIPAIKEIISHTSFSEAYEQISHLLSLNSPENMGDSLMKMVKRILGDSYKDLRYLFDQHGLSLFAPSN